MMKNCASISFRVCAFFIFAIAAVVFASVNGACVSNSPASTCADIPQGGCPLTSGADVCIDPSCIAVYACNQNGSWSLDHECPARDASVVDAFVAQEASAPIFDAAIDVPGANGGPGCADLESPDCPAGTAIDCPPGNDCCGCEDLWVCQNGGWVPWGECVDGGVSPN
jgi:hypothetical protein